MGKIQNLLYAAAMTALLCACSNSENAVDYSNDPDAVILSAGVSGTTTSRSNPIDATSNGRCVFYKGDKVAVSTNGTNYITYTLGDDGTTWSPESGKYLRWTSSEMTFTAYYPTTSGTSYSTFTTPTDQSEYHTGSNKDIALADYMTFCQSVDRPATSAAATMNFSRKMVRIEVVIDGFNDQYASTSKVSNLKITGSLDGESNYGVITPYIKDAADGSAGTTYYALVKPNGTTVADKAFITLSVGNDYLTVMGIPVMAIGLSYTYHLTVGKNTVKINSVSVQNWQTGDTITDDTDEFKEE